MVWELAAYWLSGLQRQLSACPYTKEADRHDRERARYTVLAGKAKTVEASAREELSGRMPNDYLHGACREPFAQFLLVLRRLGDSGKGHLLSEHFISDISNVNWGLSDLDVYCNHLPTITGFRRQNANLEFVAWKT